MYPSLETSLMRPRLLQRRFARRILSRGILAAILAVGLARAADGATKLGNPRIALFGETAASRDALAALTEALAPFTVVANPPEAEVAVVLQGPGGRGTAGATRFASFLTRRRSLVVIGADPTAWPGGETEVAALLGAAAGGSFAQGAAPTTLSDYGHPITAGVKEPPAPTPLRRWGGLAADTFVLQEATAGEETAPLAWIRKDATRRLVHLAALNLETLRDASARRLLTQAVWWAAERVVPGAAPQAHRTLLPDASPGAFALTFPEGVGVCFDPVRVGINYLWAGEFADLRPRWLTKQGAPARLDGPIWYREPPEPAWRTTAGGAAAEWRFRGHTTRAGTLEFHYEVAGRTVTERPMTTPDGRGLARQFTVSPGASALWLRLAPQPGVLIEVSGARHEADHAEFTNPTGGEFTVRLLRTDRTAER